MPDKFLQKNMKYLFIVNDAPYGSEKAYNAMRLASQLQKDQEGSDIRIFLMADAASCAVKDQVTPNGFYNLERMLKILISKKAAVKICGSCAEARGIKPFSLLEGAELSNMASLAGWVADSDKVLTF